MSTQRKFGLFENELLNPLGDHSLSPAEEFVASLLLNATAQTPIGIKRIWRESVRAEGIPELNDRKVKAIVRLLKKHHGFPILSRRHAPAGYWWCASEAEMREYLEWARSQPLDELHTLSKMVKQNYPALAGQLSLDSL